MKFLEWLKIQEAILVPPHMPHIFWDEMYKKAKELESKFIPMEKVYKLEKELDKEDNIEIKLSRDIPYQIRSIIEKSSGYETLSYRIKDFEESLELSGLRRDLIWGEFGTKARINILKDTNVTIFMREYSNFFKKKERYPSFKDIEDSWPDLSEETKNKVNILKSFYDNIFEYCRLLLKVRNIVKAELANWQNREKSFFADKGEDIIPKTKSIEILYHATPYMKEVLAQGFKTKEELGNINALGGDTSGGISFTADLNIAREIAKCFKEAILISQGKLKMNDVLKMIKADKKPGEKPWALEDYISSAKYKQWQKSLPKWGRDSGEPPDLNDIKQTFDLYRRYLAWSDKRYDPLFFNVNANTFKNMNVNNVGVISAKVDMTKIISYHRSMQEYRIPKEAILAIYTPNKSKPSGFLL